MKFIRISIFMAALTIIGLGFVGINQLGKDEEMGFLLGCLTLGGGLLITGLFSLKMSWHGIIGAGVLTMLGFGRGVMNFPSFAKFLIGERQRGIVPVLEFGITIICAILMMRVLSTWSAERMRRELQKS